MKVWITKFALTRGVIEVNADLRAVGQRRYAVGRTSTGNRFFTRDWFGTVQEAMKHAEQLRAAEIMKLTRRIERLKKMTFKGPT